jgi:hypothetical protein
MTDGSYSTKSRSNGYYTGSSSKKFSLFYSRMSNCVNECASAWRELRPGCLRTGPLMLRGPTRYVSKYSIFYGPKASPASWKGTYVGTDLSLVSIQLIGFCIGDSAFCPSAVRPRLPSSPLRPVTLWHCACVVVRRRCVLAATTKTGDRPPAHSQFLVCVRTDVTEVRNRP